MNRPVPHLPAPDSFDPVVDAFRAGVDMSLIEENLKLTPAQRIKKAERFIRSLDSVRGLASETNCVKK